VKEFLSRAGKAFVERGVDDDDAAYDDLLALGYRAVPVTLIGSRAIVGFDPDALATALADAD
jgi:glutaredoxin-like protein NrdH